MATIMYVKPNCPYCEAARRHFAESGEAVEERDATASRQWREELMGYTNGKGVVPTIVRETDAKPQVGFPPGRG